MNLGSRTEVIYNHYPQKQGDPQSQQFYQPLMSDNPYLNHQNQHQQQSLYPQLPPLYNTQNPSNSLAIPLVYSPINDDEYKKTKEQSLIDKYRKQIKCLLITILVLLIIAVLAYGLFEIIDEYHDDRDNKDYDDDDHYIRRFFRGDQSDQNERRYRD
ncbi:UNKNOWN [Stylonychia lemnae]|uniref:Transmembrane protein n=1 Tax=Stylonychia lemnae TaxID=5949 RepID=A0A078BBJ8_STYLE|nr:UNKNOWN [Stylonychia lemnae]|eukprot:CDW90642.1 UNKNOWN [Stylonychia lemnae]